MKKLFYLLFFTISLISCEKDSLEYQNEFDKSYNTWLQFSKANNNTYSYTYTTSSWTGLSTMTTIYVEKNQVIKREFKIHSLSHDLIIPDGGWTKDIVIKGLKEKGYTEDEIKSSYGETIIDRLQWIETKENLGTHGNKNELMTLEQVYHKAKNDWVLKRDKATVYFEAKNNGLISMAGYVPANCADDCFVGIHIEKIQRSSSN